MEELDKYEPKDEDEALVLDYLKKNKGEVKYYTHFLASLSLKTPDGGTTTPPVGKNTEDEPQNTKK